MNNIYIILSLLVSILSVVWIILTYFGIVRYISIHCRSPESWIESFQKLEKAGTKGERVVANITIKNKSDLEKLPKAVASLLNQTLRIDEIGVNLPKSLGPLPKGLDKIVRTYPISLTTCEKDDCLPSVLREGNINTLIINVQPDIVYGIDYIEDLIDLSVQNPDTVIVDKKKQILLIKPSFICPETLDEHNNLAKSCSKASGKTTLNYKENYSAF